MNKLIWVMVTVMSIVRGIGVAVYCYCYLNGTCQLQSVVVLHVFVPSYQNDQGHIVLGLSVCPWTCTLFVAFDQYKVHCFICNKHMLLVKHFQMSHYRLLCDLDPRRSMVVLLMQILHSVKYLSGWLMK